MKFNKFKTKQDKTEEGDKKVEKNNITTTSKQVEGQSGNKVKEGKPQGNLFQAMMNGNFRRINPLKSVGARLFIVFFVPVMIFVFTLGNLSYSKAKNTIEKNAFTANEQTIIQTSQKLDIILKQYEESVNQVFFEAETQELIRDMANVKTEQYEKYVNVNKMNKKMSSWIYTAGGMNAAYLIAVEDSFEPIYVGDVDKKILDNYKDSEWFKHLDKKNQAQWFASPEDEGKVFHLAKLITLLPSSEYIVISDIKVSVLEEQLAKLNLGEDSTVRMVNSDGYIIASTIGDEGGNTEANLESASKAEFLEISSELEHSGWSLKGKIPVDSLVKDAKDILKTTYITALIVGLVTIALSIWIVRMIAYPLGRMNDLMLKGAKGNLSVRSEHKSQDEMGQLSVGFNIMMENITGLVKKVTESAQEVLTTAKDLTGASGKTAISAREIAIATDEIAKGASSLAVEAERGNTLTDSISKQMDIVISLNGQMGVAAREVEKSSQLGTEHLNELLSKTHTTAEMTSSLSDKVDSLRQSSLSVHKVLEVMQNITQQTNILSLNATIEAARAGVAGRGFMVVADEIRQLAEQSKQSIKMVGDITNKIEQEMSETVQVLANATPLYQEQIKSVEVTSELFFSVEKKMEGFIVQLDSVTESIRNLSHAQEVLSNSMSNVSAVAEESSATSEEVASLSTEQQDISEQLVSLSNKLEDVSTELKDSLSKFRV